MAPATDFIVKFRSAAKPADRAASDAGPALLDHGRHYADQDDDRDRQQDVRELAAPCGFGFAGMIDGGLQVLA